MPNQPKTPIRCVRISDVVWDETKAIAAEKGVTVSELVRQFLETFIAENRPPLPVHSCQHKAYRMTCKEYDDLAAAVAGRCQLCRKPKDRLVIDHDHALGFDAVRGLVCPPCNAKLARIDAGQSKITHKAAVYMVSAWHLHKGRRTR